MRDYSTQVRARLNGIIEQMSLHRDLFVKKPGKDFARERKLPFDTMMKLLLCMGGNSINKELMEYSGYSVETASASAFVQQRDKILAVAFEYLLHEFTNSCVSDRLFDGYRLIAVDGSPLRIATNPSDIDTYFQNNSATKGFNLLYLNAMYDLCNKLYLDACIQPGKQKNEYQSLITMVDRSPISGKVIIVADRGLESYNNFAHIEQKGWNYAIRARDIDSNGILSALQLPPDEEFDVQFHRILTRRYTKEVRYQRNIYHFMPSVSRFDFFDMPNNPYYPFSFSVVRFKISEHSYTSIITNLDPLTFPVCKIKQIYRLRWGIETSFRELKYAIGLVSFHSKKADYIVQEIFARLIMYNFCELITLHVFISQNNNKHAYQANFTAAIHICKRFFRYFIRPPDVEALIQRYILPVRPNRTQKRALKNQSSVSFIYRVA